jgi:hypothetical protein
MADVTDRYFVMLAPKERDSGESFTMSHHVERCGLSLTFRHGPVFGSNGSARMRIGPSRDIASGEHTLRARFQAGIHYDSALDGDTRLCGTINSGTDADTGNDEVA